MCSQLRNGRYRLIIERYTEPRTLSQNALMWLWFTCIEQETGTEKNVVHKHYCRKFLSENRLFPRNRGRNSQRHIGAEHRSDDGLFE